MVCPEGWLDWDTYGVLIQAQSLSLAIKLTITRGPLFSFCAQIFAPEASLC